jgi:CRP-like cAMP-binding protein
MPFRNRLLAELPHRELELLVPHLASTNLQHRQSILEAGLPIDAVCFPEDAVISIVSLMSDGTTIETGVVGHEGMVGMSLFHGVDRTVTPAFVQVPGKAQLMPAAEFTRLLEELPVLQGRLHRYAVALFTSVAQTSACNRLHSIERRCARWLLSVHDGVGRDQFEVTHKFLAELLGVRRATVTVAAGQLQQRELISYSRGRLTIRDRDGLEGVACECYRVVRDEIDRLMDGGAAPATDLASAGR